LECTGRTTSLGAVVRNPYSVCSPSTGFFCGQETDDEDGDDEVHSPPPAAE
jgi:hypothetical protein